MRHVSLILSDSVGRVKRPFSPGLLGGKKILSIHKPTSARRWLYVLSRSQDLNTVPGSFPIQ